MHNTVFRTAVFAEQWTRKPGKVGIMAQELNRLQNISHLKLFKCFMRKILYFNSFRCLELTLTKFKDVNVLQESGIISLRILNRIQYFVKFLFNARCVSEHQKDADLQPSLDTNFSIILSSCDNSPLVIMVPTCYLQSQKNNYLVMVPINRHHYRISNPPQVTMVQIFLYSCT
jgi:hypothetical protein